jgi:hypothetical protein
MALFQMPPNKVTGTANAASVAANTISADKTAGAIRGAISPPTPDSSRAFEEAECEANASMVRTPSENGAITSYAVVTSQL